MKSEIWEKFQNFHTLKLSILRGRILAYFRSTDSGFRDIAWFWKKYIFKRKTTNKLPEVAYVQKHEVGLRGEGRQCWVKVMGKKCFFCRALPRYMLMLSHCLPSPLGPISSFGPNFWPWRVRRVCVATCVIPYTWSSTLKLILFNLFMLKTYHCNMTTVYNQSKFERLLLEM